MSKTRNDITVIDGSSLFDACQLFSERQDTKIVLDYSYLKKLLDNFRAEADWNPATTTTILLSSNPETERHQKFRQMLEKAGFETEDIWYQDTFISTPPGRSHWEFRDRQLISLSSRLSFITALMTRYNDCHYMLVTHAFELYAPLLELRRRVPKSRVGIAYFRSLMDHRWKPVGLFSDDQDKKQNIEFFDLEPFGPELVGFNFDYDPEEVGDVVTGFNRF